MFIDIINNTFFTPTELEMGDSMIAGQSKSSAEYDYLIKFLALGKFVCIFVFKIRYNQ